MDIINNIEWYFGKPKDAINKDTGKKITKKSLKTIVFDDTVKENIKFCFPLNDDFTYTETRELSRPINVEQLLQFISDFYNEPLKQETIDKSFKTNEQLKEDWITNMIDCFGDINNLTNYQLFDDTCTPDFCGIHLTDDGEYFINIGPE